MAAGRMAVTVPLIASIVLACVGSLPLTQGTDEKSLVKDLFKDYDVQIRPMSDYSEVMNLKLGLTNKKVLKLDENAQTLKMLAYVDMEWKDEFLTWNPSQYGNIASISVSQDKVWTPTITLENSADATVSIDKFLQEGAMVTVYSDGKVTWSPGGILLTKCDVSTVTYPYDNQVCSLKFAAGNKMRLVNGYFNTGFGEVSVEWRWLTEGVFDYIDNSRQSLLMFYLQLERKEEFHEVSVLAPAILMSVLILFQFALPVETRQRITYAANLFVAGFGLLLLTAYYVPNTGELTYFNLYVTIIQGLVVTSMIWTTLVEKIFHTTMENRPPYCLRAISRCCVSKCCDDRPVYMAPRLKHLIRDSPLVVDTKIDTEDRHRDSKEGPLNLEAVLARQLALLTIERERKDEKERIRLNRAEWHDVGRVLDRLAFVITSFIIVALPIVLFLILPHFTTEVMTPEECAEYAPVVFYKNPRRALQCTKETMGTE